MIKNTEELETYSVESTSKSVKIGDLGVDIEDGIVSMTVKGEAVLLPLSSEINEEIQSLESDIVKSNKDLQERGLNLKSYGAKGNKVQDDTSYIQGLIDSMKTKSVYASTVIEVPAGNYLVTRTIHLPPYVRLESRGVVKITYTGTGACFHVFNDKNPQEDSLKQTGTNAGDVMKGTFIITGNRTPGQVAIKIGEDALNILHVTHTAWCKFENIYIDNFDIGILFTQKQTYITRFFNIVMSHCGKCISDLGNFENAGELITWTDCSFHNSDLFLEVNSEIYHSFKGCSIDYSKKGIIFKNNKYVTTRISDSWIEGNGQGADDFFAESLNTSHVATLVLNGCLLYTPTKVPKMMLKGKMHARLTNCDIQMNRFNNPSINSKSIGQVLCGDDVMVAGTSGTIFKENGIAISRTLSINTNSDFELDSVGSTTITGFTRSGAQAVISDEKKYTGTKSLKILNGGADYVDLSTEIFDVRYAERIYSQINYFVDASNPSLNFTMHVLFYKDDGATQVGSTYSLTQNIDVDAQYANDWFCLKEGIIPQRIPAGATKCRVRLVIGKIANAPLYVDNFIVTPI